MFIESIGDIGHTLVMLLWVLTPIGVIETTVETVLSASRDPTDKLLRCPGNIAARLA